MASEPILSARNLSYRFPRPPGDGLRARLRRKIPPPSQWVLQDINLDVAAGDSLALVGFNGAGKSTLLRLLAGILSPTNGSVSRRKRVAALIDMGATINPDLSGLENIELAGALAGLGRREASEGIEEAAEFCDLGDALYRPVSEYSRGMRARVSFAAATAFLPDILLIDEVLAVGDVTFQSRCIHRLLKFRNDGGTLVFVSHNAANITSVCNSGIHLHDGKVVIKGTASEAIESMYRLKDREDAALRELRDRERATAIEGASRQGTGVSIRTARVQSGDRASPVWGERTRIEVEIDASEPKVVRWYFGVFLADEVTCVIGYLHDRELSLPAGRSLIRSEIAEFPILPGNYKLHACLFEEDQFAAPLDEIGWVRLGHPFVVEPSSNPTARLMAATGQVSSFGHTTTVDVDVLGSV